MTKLEAIATAKQFRKDADELLQRMKEHILPLKLKRENTAEESFVDSGEVIAQHILSIRDLESCIMRQGMALKYIGNPDPYPESRNPESPVVEPTADGLKL
jgi:hypothetical protein